MLIVFWELLSSATSPAGRKKMPLGITPWVDLRSAATSAFGRTFPGAEGARTGPGAVGRQLDSVGAAGPVEALSTGGIQPCSPSRAFPISLHMFTIINTIRVNVCANHQL